MLSGRIETERSYVAFHISLINVEAEIQIQVCLIPKLSDSKDSESLWLLWICPYQIPNRFIEDYGWRIWLNFVEQQIWSKLSQI